MQYSNQPGALEEKKVGPSGSPAPTSVVRGVAGPCVTGELFVTLLRPNPLLVLMPILCQAANFWHTHSHGVDPKSSLRFGSSAPRLLQRGVVDDETVFHVAFQEALVGFVNLLDADHFNVCGDSVLRAEIQHLLGFADSADG